MKVYKATTVDAETAGGRYENIESEDYAFVLVSDVAIYGDFDGTETSLAERNDRISNNVVEVDGSKCTIIKR